MGGFVVESPKLGLLTQSTESQLLASGCWKEIGPYCNVQCEERGSPASLYLPFIASHCLIPQAPPVVRVEGPYRQKLEAGRYVLKGSWLVSNAVILREFMIVWWVPAGLWRLNDHSYISFRISQKADTHH